MAESPKHHGVHAGPSLGGWHLGTVPRALRLKGVLRYGSDRCNRWWINDQSKQFPSP